LKEQGAWRNLLSGDAGADVLELSRKLARQYRKSECDGRNDDPSDQPIFKSGDGPVICP
jgi:hypothetical protein